MRSHQIPECHAAVPPGNSIGVIRLESDDGRHATAEPQTGTESRSHIPPLKEPGLSTDVLRYTAFATEPTGGNPAGVVLDATDLDEPSMLAIAARLGYSESAFATPGEEERRMRLRFFSPKAEVSFCGHATVATAVALAQRDGAGTFVFDTMAGEVPVEVAQGADGVLRATLTSVEPAVSDIDDRDVAQALRLLNWDQSDLDTALPPRIAYAGARHLVLAVGTRARLAELDYDFDGLAQFMTARDLTTLQLVWRESVDTFHVRDPFPVGGVVEDAATGAAAAALGAYLRELGEVPAQARLTLHQGHDMGRPALLRVEMRAGDPRIRVSGAAVPLPEPGNR